MGLLGIQSFTGEEMLNLGTYDIKGQVGREVERHPYGRFLKKGDIIKLLEI